MKPLSRVAGALADLGVVVLIFATLEVPTLSDFVGALFDSDNFFHWDHFVMAPALAWRHGQALGTDVYSQYGAGWPVVVDALSRWIPFTHQNVIGLAIFYGCVLHVGLYALLLRLSRSRLLAVAGTVLALFLSPFAPIVSVSHVTALWEWPSLTVLRSPMDVWFFLALLAHARGRRPAAAVLAGLLVGLALFLETDTGIFLCATYAVYGVCLALADRMARLEGRPLGVAGSRHPAAVLAATVAALLAVLVSGLLVSSRGALFADPGRFLHGWINGVTNSSALGVGARYFNWFLVNHGEDLPWALAVMGSGLLAVGFTLARLIHGRLGPQSLFAGCVGAYTVSRCILFVWRTNPIRLTLVAIPLSILVVLLLAELRRPAGDALRRLSRRPAGAFDHVLPLLALACALWLVVASPSFRSYPNVWWLALHGPPAPGLALFPERGELTGLPPRDRGLVLALRATIREVQRRAARGERVAVLDLHKTLIFTAADAPPWRGSPSWFANTWTHDEVAELVAAIGPAGPDVVIIRSGPTVGQVRDVWDTLHAEIEAHYRLVDRIGFFEVWERRRPGEGAARPPSPLPSA